jgi:hypothetical protein
MKQEDSDMSRGVPMKSLYAAVIVLPLLIVLRLGADQILGYRAAMEHLGRGDAKNAIMYFGRVLEAHIPYSPVERRSWDRLLELAAGFEEEGDMTMTLLCYETARSSRYLSRHLLLPDGRHIASLNSRIASIKAGMIARSDPGRSREAAFAEQMRTLGRDYSPRLLPAVCSMIIFFLFISASAAWGWTMRRRYALWALVLFLLWITALYSM